MIRAALFDFGGVILSSPFEAFADFERRNGLPDGVIRQLNATNPDSNAWAKLERSEVDLSQFAAIFSEEAREAGHEIDGAAVLGLLGGSVRPAMVEAVRRCSEQLVTGLLTNNFVSRDRAPESDVEPATDLTGRAAQVAEIMAMFDGVVESSKVGVRKPDPRFYEIACTLLEIEPHEAVFLDDLGINLKPARAMGMTTIKVGDPDVAIAELEQVVGFPLR
jgi:putative hydrolase of the HAD superfamily